MHYLLSSSLVLSFLIASASTAPWSSGKPSEKAYSKIHRQRIPSTPKNGLFALNHAFEKYGLSKPDALPASVSAQSATSPGAPNQLLATKGSSGDVSATSVMNSVEYICPVSIGTPKQLLNLNFDTGSTDLWVFNTESPADSKQANRTIFNPYASRTYENVTGYTYSTYFGDDSQSYGFVGVDTVEISGLTVYNQAVGLATSVSNGFKSDTYADGILGLGFTSNSKILPKKQPSWFENIKTTLQNDVFTANLKKGSVGNYQFGFIDNTAYKGDKLYYAPVDTSNGTWVFKVGENSPGVADTGSSLLVLDEDLVKSYYEKVPNNVQDKQGYTFPCDTELPDFSITLGDSYTATIAGELLNYAQTSDPNHFCYGGIQSNNQQGLNIFGDILFESQFVVFDYAQTRIGFAPHA